MNFIPGTASEPDARLWELRPRCLVVCPDLSLEEFADGPWASVKGTHESVNFWAGDALLYLDRFGEAGAQLLDESLTPARMDQLKWVSKSIPPARRRDGCNWTIHRMVAGLFGRRGKGSRLFPAHYLDRKTALQDELLARAEGERWHSPTMAAEIERLEDEARNYASNSAPRSVGGEVDDESCGDAGEAERAPHQDARDAPGNPSDHEPADCGAGVPSDRDSADHHSDHCGSAEIAAPTDGSSAPAEAEPLETVATARAMPWDSPVSDHGEEPPEIGTAILSAFPEPWHGRLVIATSTDDAGHIRWVVRAYRSGQRQPLGIAATLAEAVAEAGAGAHALDAEATARLRLVREPRLFSPPPDAPGLSHPYLSLPPDAQCNVRDWAMRGNVLGEPFPVANGSVFRAAWDGATDADRKAFVGWLAMSNIRPAAATKIGDQPK